MKAKYYRVIDAHTIRIRPAGVAAFNARWPCSTLSDRRGYTFGFDARMDLVDTDVPPRHDGPAAAALSRDAQAILFLREMPEWAV